MFGSMFNTYHGTPTLCCITTDLGSFYLKNRDFVVLF